MAKAKADDQVLKLAEMVRRQKAEIAAVGRYAWRTNCSIAVSGDRINLHVESDVRKLVAAAAVVRERNRSYVETADEMGVEAPPFDWCGYPAADWVADIKARIDKLAVAAKQTRLAELEKKLDGMVSPELKRQMELDAIAAELGG